MTWILLALACAHSGDTILEESKEVPIEDENPSVQTDAPDSLSEEEMLQCMNECMQQNQMRAVGIEVIKADCTTSCTGTQEPLGTQPIPPAPREDNP